MSLLENRVSDQEAHASSICHGLEGTVVSRDRFKKRFAGLERSYGTYTINEAVKTASGKKEGKAQTVHRQLTDDVWERHLEGKQGLGICPITDDATCNFGAIDVDRYDLDLPGLERMVISADLPLIPCRTKSGGAHLYLFLAEPVEAQLVRKKLAEWSVILGCSGSEIFPKQDRLLRPDDAGSWINLPYFTGDRTTRYAIIKGAAATLAEFLDHADQIQVTKKQLKKITPKIDEVLLGAPPCIQALITNGIGDGMRNEAAFALGVFARKKFGTDWESMLAHFNQNYINPPLTPQELGGIAKSLDRKDYAYPCKHQILAGACDRNLCLQREFGVAGAGTDPGVAITGLVKILTDPPTWVVTVNEKRIQLGSTEDLIIQRRFNVLVVETINVLPKAVKAQAWERIVQKLLEEVVEMEAPKDAGRVGQLMGTIDYFLTERPKARTVEELLLGKCFIEDGVTYFRSSDLMKFLDTNKIKGIGAREIWNLLSQIGASTKRFRVKNRHIRCWGVAVVQMESTEIPAHETEQPEF